MVPMRMLWPLRGVSPAALAATSANRCVSECPEICLSHLGV